MSYTESILGMLSSNIDQRNDLIITPVPIAKEMVNILPEEVWNKDTTFLDPACKSGIFLHEIYLKLMETPAMIQEFPDKAERRKHILQNQLFGIALNPMCQLTSARTVYGTIKGENNIKLIDNYITIVKNKDTRFFKEALEKEFNREMKFDVVIGNPPYQQATQSIYQNFIDLAIELNPHSIVMITKNNWLESNTLKNTRDKMIGAGLKKVINYPIFGEVFSDVGVAVSIFSIENEYTGNFEYTEVRNGKITDNWCSNIKGYAVILGNHIENSIYQKIRMSDDLHNNFGDKTLPAEAFRINSNGNVGRGINTYSIDDVDNKSDIHNIAIAYMSRSRALYYRYAKLQDIPARQEVVGEYKIICGEKISKNGNILTSLHVLEPMSVCSGSYVCIWHDNSREKTINAAKYIKSRFLRMLVYMLCSDGMNGISSYRFSLIPLQNFASTFKVDLGRLENDETYEITDIDWSQSIADIDKQLYKKYNLTQEEINYIEKTIKPMQ